MERYVRDKWERKLFKEETVTEFLFSSTTDSDLQTQQSENYVQQRHQRQDSTMSTASSLLQQQQLQQIGGDVVMDLHTPSLSSTSSSSLISSPIIQPLAGRMVVPQPPVLDSPTIATMTNPFLVNKTSSFHNPFSNSSFTATTAGKTPCLLEKQGRTRMY